MATLRIDCPDCDGFGGFGDRADPYAYPTTCENCRGEGEIDARCDTPRCNRHATTGIDGEYYCDEHAADFEELAPVVWVGPTQVAA